LRLLLRRDADAGVADGDVEVDGALGPRPELDADGDLARSVNFVALPTRLTRIWLSRPGSPRTASGTSGATEWVSSRPFSSTCKASVLSVSPRVSRRLKGTDSNSSQPASIFEKSRMSFSSRRSASADDFARVRNSRCGAGGLNQGQVEHPEHAVHRGPDLVAHVGQELALGPGGGHGGLLGLYDFRLGPLTLLISSTVPTWPARPPSSEGRTAARAWIQMTSPPGVSTRYSCE